MTQTSNRFYDRFAQLMNDAASVAQGVRREATTMFRGQAERMANDMDLVKREDFDAVKEMARKSREENAKLEKRIAELEAKLGGTSSAKASSSSAAKAGTASSKSSTAKRATGGSTGAAKPRATRSRTAKPAGGSTAATEASSGGASTGTSDAGAADESKA